MKPEIVIFWYRRDLRLHDNPALEAALSSGDQVLPVFIFDTDILSRLRNRKDARVLFIYRELLSIQRSLEKWGSSLHLFYGNPLEAFRYFTEKFRVHRVYANRDYEPRAELRDRQVEQYLLTKGTEFHTFKDHVIFEKGEVVKEDGAPYTVFTPYSRKWKSLLNHSPLKTYSSSDKLSALYKTSPVPIPALEEIGFTDFHFDFPGRTVKDALLRGYADTRNFPAVNGTSRLGIHLRFGTVSIRELTLQAVENSPEFLNELIWRNFFIDILAHFPYVEDAPFKKKYSFIEWRNNEEEFNRWCRGETGFPVVDAGMRELNETGFMHNRVRMITASFLTKHLLIDWRWGEAWFAEKLNDYELASNNGNWQWAAGCGCDAVPYFRIFNPELQQKKYDPEGEYVRKWVPEAGSSTYPKPVTEHSAARERALRIYKKGIA